MLNLGMRTTPDYMKQIHYTDRAAQKEHSFVAFQHRDTRTLVLQELSFGSLDPRNLPLAIQQLYREYIWLANDVVILLHSKDQGYWRLTFDIKRGKGMMPATYKYYNYDVSNVKVEFYSKDLKSHETLYSSKE